MRYVRDAADRIIERRVNEAVVARYGYSASGDTADFTMDANGNAIERTPAGWPAGYTLCTRCLLASRR